MPFPRLGNIVPWLSVAAVCALGCSPEDTPPPEVRAAAIPAMGDVAFGDTAQAKRASARLIAPRSTVKPGETLELGLTFDIEPGWHLYWQGRNDSGLYPMVTWNAPGTVVLDEFLWPAPERKVSPGSILDHVYHDRVTLLVPVTVAEDAAPGDELVIRGDASWVVCREACFAEKGTVELRLKVVEEPDAVGSGIPGDAVRIIDEARKRIPEPLPTGQEIVQLERRGDRLTVQVPSGTELSFFPALDCVQLTDPVRDAHAEGDRLDLQLLEPAPDSRLRGVLEVRYDAPRPARHFAIDLPVPAPAG